MHQGLDLGEILGRTALDQVAGHGERPSGKADERHAQLTGQYAHGLDDVGRVDLRLEWPQAVQVFLPLERLVHDRTGTRCHIDAEPDCRYRHHDVGEEDGGIGPIAIHRLSGECGDQLRLGDGVEDAPRTAGGPILGEGPPCLAHEPHRNVVHGEPPAGADER